MSILEKLGVFVVKVAGATAAQWYLFTKILDIPLPGWVSPWLLFASLSLVILALDGAFIYPRFRNPLRHLPTPNLEGYSELELITERPRGATSLKWMMELPDADLIHIYGWPNGSQVIPVSPNALRDVMATNTYAFEKPSGPASFLNRIIGRGLILSEGDAHRHQRRVLTPAFNIRNIRALYGFMFSKVGTLLEQLEKFNKQDGSIEISGWASLLTLDIIGPTALSRDFNSMAAGTEHEIARAFSELLEPKMDMAIYFALHFFFPVWLMKLIPVRGNRLINYHSTTLRAICRGILNEKKPRDSKYVSEKKNAEEQDILQNIISQGEFSDEEVIDQMLTFLAAGHETTASALTWMVHLLTLPEYSHYQNLLREEIRSAIPPPEDGKLTIDNAPTYATLESLPYLNGICEETFRLFPTVPVTLRNAVCKTTIAGSPIPKGTWVVIPTYAINRNPRYWGPDADTMKPERWIDVTPEGTQRVNKHGGVTSNFCETTFLHGQRACIGRDFAKAELRCAVAGLFGRFSMARLPGDDGTVEVAGTITTKPEGGLKVHLERVPGW